MSCEAFFTENDVSKCFFNSFSWKKGRKMISRSFSRKIHSRKFPAVFTENYFEMNESCFSVKYAVTYLTIKPQAPVQMNFINQEHVLIYLQQNKIL